MKEYLKMSDVFEGEVQDGSGTVFSLYGCGVNQLRLNGKCATYAANAINSHDDLVENYHLAAKERGEWEARACTEASRVHELVADVERLRSLCDGFSFFCEEVGEFMGTGREVNQYRNAYEEYKKEKGL